MSSGTDVHMGPPFWAPPGCPMMGTTRVHGGVDLNRVFPKEHPMGGLLPGCWASAYTLTLPNMFALEAPMPRGLPVLPLHSKAAEHPGSHSQTLRDPVSR